MKKVKCSVEGCEYNAHARGLCCTHYGQVWRNGSVTDAPLRQRKCKNNPSYLLLLCTRKVEESEKDVAASQRMLNTARVCYEQGISVPVRMKWKRAINSSLSELRLAINEQCYANLELYNAIKELSTMPILNITVRWWYDEHTDQHKLVGSFPLVKCCLAIISRLNERYSGQAICDPSLVVEHTDLCEVQKSLLDVLSKAYSFEVDFSENDR